jgi:hypothetical protein
MATVGMATGAGRGMGKACLRAQRHALLPASDVSARYLPRAKVAPPSTGITVPVTYRPARDDR